MDNFDYDQAMAASDPDNTGMAINLISFTLEKGK